MKLLLCNNYYRIRAGEDISFDRDVEMLRDQGHEVVTLTRHNDNLGEVSKLSQAKRTVWAADAEREAEALIQREQPDLMHCNNLFPQLSPSIYRPANRAGIPVVQAVRNYRYFCAGSALYRDGQVCTDCLTKTVGLAAVRHACYRNNRLMSGLVVAAHAYHRLVGTWENRVNAFFSPTAFARETCLAGGFPADRFHVRTNFVYPDLGVGSGNGGYALYVGRLSEEKGINTLIEAWSRHTPSLPLKVIGEGDSDLTDRLNTLGDHVELLGPRPQQEALELLGGAACLVFTSQWYETFGRVIAESFSRGTPVVASNLGAMTELIDHGRNGYLFEPGDAAALTQYVNQIATNQPKTQPFRQAARSAFTERFNRERSYQQLLRVYAAAAENAGASLPHQLRASEA